MKVIEAREIFAYCFKCEKVIAEIDLNSYNDPEKFVISRRVVYESAERHKELAPKHKVIVYDLQESARQTMPN